MPQQVLTLLHAPALPGIGDTVADEGTMANVNDIIEQAKADVTRIIEELQSGALESQPGRTMMESFENRVNQVRR